MRDPLDLRFAVVVLAVVLAIRVFRAEGRLRQAVFLVAAGLIVASGGWAVLGAYAALAAYGFVALRSGLDRTGVAPHAVVLSLLLAASTHAVGWQGDWPEPWRVLPLVGLPYVYLRLLHLLMDVRRARLAPPPALEYATYLVPFHQLVAGPIERFEDFRSKLRAALPPLSADHVARALGRLTNGLVKKVVLAETIRRVAGFEFERTGWALLLEIDLQAVYVYLDFSGYMDIVIGVGMLVGWEPPENFNWPYFSRNIIEFWRRWHITLSDWIRDYVFVPMNLSLQRGPLRGQRLAAGAVCYLTGMIFCGLWHRADVPFALWGGLHGLALVCAKCYEALLRRVVGSRRLHAYRRSRVAAVAAGVLNFHFVSISFLFALQDPRRAIEILGGLV